MLALVEWLYRALPTCVTEAERQMDAELRRVVRKGVGQVGRTQM